MLTFVGYIPLRRGLFEHLHEGRLTMREFEVFVILLMWADHRTGIAYTNAPGIVYLSGEQLDPRYTQECLLSLEKKGYIKRPFFVQGQRCNQKIFIDKYVVTLRGAKGTEVKVLSFADTTDWNNPAYVELREDRGEDSGESRGDNSGAHSGSNEKLRTETLKSEKVSGSVKGTQDKTDSLRDDQLSETKTNANTLLAREFAARLGAIEEAQPVQSSSKTPSSAAPRAKFDALLLKESWGKFLRTVDMPSGTEDMFVPGDKEFHHLLNRTTDSVERVLEVVRWALETGDYWFKKPEGRLRTFTDLGNAYPSMSKQYGNYKAKGAGA